MASTSGNDLGNNEFANPVEKLIARADIDHVLANWVHGLDTRNEGLWLSVFHDDGVFEVDAPAALAEGRDAILLWAREPWRFQTITHITGAHQIEFSDCEHATGVGRGVGIFKIENGALMLTTGKLEDRFVKKDGVWKLSYRKVNIISSFLINGATDLILNGVFV